MTRPQPPELPEHKPVAEMTREERIEYARELGRVVRKELAELNRPRRERRLRAGRATPRNRARAGDLRGGLAEGEAGRSGWVIGTRIVIDQARHRLRLRGRAARHAVYRVRRLTV